MERINDGKIINKGWYDIKNYWEVSQYEKEFSFNWKYFIGSKFICT